jgi:hypothetical protein
MVRAGGTSAGIVVLSGVAFVGLAGLGAFIAPRRPDNPIGWLLGTGGLIFLLDNLMKLYAGSADILGLPGRDLVEISHDIGDTEGALNSAR